MKPLVVLLCCLLAAPLAAAAAEPSLLVVLADSGTTPGSVSVVVESATGRDRREARISRERPALDIGPLHPGDYDVSIVLDDGRSAGERVAITIGTTVVLVVTMPANASVPPVLERRQAFQSIEGARFGRRALDDLPVDNAWGLVETAAPFVVADRLSTGGLGLGRSALVSARGESWALTSMSIGGIPVRSPTPSGRLPAIGDLSFAEAIVAASGLSNVEVETPGLAIDIVPKRAGNVWTGAFDASATTPGMVGENAFPDVPSIERIEDWRAASANAGGPIAGQTGLFVSAGFARATNVEREQSDLLTSRTRSVTTHVDGSPGAGQRISVLGGFEAAEYPYDDRQQLAVTSVNERARFGRGRIAWSGGIGGGSLEAAMSLQRGSWRPDISGKVDGGVVDRVFHGVVPRPPADVIHTHVDARVDWSAASRRWGGASHAVRAGVSFRRTTATRETLALPTVAETVQREAARVWMPARLPAVSDRHVQETGVYLADRIVAGPSFTIDLGVRADLARGTTAGSDTGIDWRTVSPRAAFRWHPAAPVSFFGGVGRYAGGHPVAFLAFGDPGEVEWDVHRWQDPDRDGRYADGEVGELLSRAGFGPAVASLDPDLRVPRSTEWTAGVELRPTEHSMLRGAIIIRRQTDLVGVVNTGLTDADYRGITIEDIGADEGSAHDDQLLPIYERLPSSYGRDQLLLTNPAAAEPIRHDGIEVTYEIASPRWLMIVGATAYRTVGRGGALGFRALENDPLALGDRYWNPNALQDPEGRLFFDRAYVGKWTTAYRAPGDVTLAAVVRYQDGQPFTRDAAVPVLGTGPEIVHAYAMGRTRFTYTATVDARIEKGFALGAGRRASVRLDIFNLTNHANEVEEDVWTGPDFRRSTLVQPPRTVRVGMRVEF